MTVAVPLPLLIVGAAALFGLGGFVAYWFEDVLRGPIMRVYDQQMTLPPVTLTNED